MKLLLVGADGNVARYVGNVLQGDYDLRLLVHKGPSGLDGEDIFGDVREPGDVARAMEGVDVVLHFAIARYSRRGEEPEIDIAQGQFDVNVKGLYNVVATAAQHGVKRFIYTSSMTVSRAGQESRAGDRLMTEAEPVTPKRAYPHTKYLGEEICRCHADQFPLGVICLRLGNVVPKGTTPLDETKWYPGWVHGEDVGEAFRLAIEAEDIGFEVFHIFADVPGLKWDNAKAKRLLGFTAKHRFEDLWHKTEG
jgi:uronate dehydrogenase